MPIQAPQWTDFLTCPVCLCDFDDAQRIPISLSCAHTICVVCIDNLSGRICPFDQAPIPEDIKSLLPNNAILQLLNLKYENWRDKVPNTVDTLYHNAYKMSNRCIEALAFFLKPLSKANRDIEMTSLLSRPLQRKLVTLINCQLGLDEGRLRAVRSARSIGERTVTELILQHQNGTQLSTNLWAAVRARGCQFLGPAMQEETLKLVLLALENGAALSRKVLVLFVVQRLEQQFPQASKTSVGHVVQLLYRASCFNVTKREEESSLMELKEEFRQYDSLRREHDTQIVQIAIEAGLRISPEQWSSLLYGDLGHKSHMQSIIDKLQTPESFSSSIRELTIALQRSSDPAQLSKLRLKLEQLANIDQSTEIKTISWKEVMTSLQAAQDVVVGLVDFLKNHSLSKRVQEQQTQNIKYKTSKCRDIIQKGGCPRGSSCTFAHSDEELEKFRSRSRRMLNTLNRQNSRSMDHNGMDPGVQPGFGGQVFGNHSDLNTFNQKESQSMDKNVVEPGVQPGFGNHGVGNQSNLNTLNQQDSRSMDKNIMEPGVQTGFGSQRFGNQSDLNTLNQQNSLSMDKNMMEADVQPRLRGPGLGNKSDLQWNSGGGVEGSSPYEKYGTGDVNSGTSSPSVHRHTPGTSSPSVHHHTPDPIHNKLIPQTEHPKVEASELSDRLPTPLPLTHVGSHQHTHMQYRPRNGQVPRQSIPGGIPLAMMRSPMPTRPSNHAGNEERTVTSGVPSVPLEAHKNWRAPLNTPQIRPPEDGSGDRLGSYELDKSTQVQINGASNRSKKSDHVLMKDVHGRVGIPSIEQLQQHKTKLWELLNDFQSVRPEDKYERRHEVAIASQMIVGVSHLRLDDKRPQHSVHKEMHYNECHLPMSKSHSEKMNQEVSQSSSAHNSPWKVSPAKYTTSISKVHRLHVWANQGERGLFDENPTLGKHTLEEFQHMSQGELEKTLAQEKKSASSHYERSSKIQMEIHRRNHGQFDSNDASQTSLVLPSGPVSRKSMTSLRNTRPVRVNAGFSANMAPVTMMQECHVSPGIQSTPGVYDYFQTGLTWNVPTARLKILSVDTLPNTKVEMSETERQIAKELLKDQLQTVSKTIQEKQSKKCADDSILLQAEYNALGDIWKPFNRGTYPFVEIENGKGKNLSLQQNKTEDLLPSQARVSWYTPSMETLSTTGNVIKIPCQSYWEESDNRAENTNTTLGLPDHTQQSKTITTNYIVYDDGKLLPEDEVGGDHQGYGTGWGDDHGTPR